MDFVVVVPAEEDEVGELGEAAVFHPGDVVALGLHQGVGHALMQRVPPGGVGVFGVGVGDGLQLRLDGGAVCGIGGKCHLEHAAAAIEPGVEAALSALVFEVCRFGWRLVAASVSAGSARA
jgi:hypothetical protein